MKRNASFFEGASCVVTAAACALVTGCMPIVPPGYDDPPPSIDQVRSAVAEQKAANRRLVEQLEARLSSKVEQTAAPDIERQLTRSLKTNLSGAETELRDIRCRGNLCKVEISVVGSVDAGAVLAALALAHTCAMPLIDLPEAAIENTVTAYIDCDAARQ